MKTELRLLTALFTLLPAVAMAGGPSPAAAPEDVHEIVKFGDGTLLTSSAALQSLASRETTGPDTFALFGGPDQLVEGKFQLADEVTPSWGGAIPGPGNDTGDPDAWTGHDLTDLPTYWHRSTFNGELFGDPGNHVFWCGTGNGDPNESPIAGWATPPGYGNNWDDIAVFRYTMVDPSVGQTVALNFDYNSETEPGYDYFIIEYDSAGVNTEVLRCDAWNSATTYLDQGPGPIVYEPFSYGGEGGDEIIIRLRMKSDGAWSDQDGLWPTDGAAQVDNITLSFTDGFEFQNFTEDFEAEQPESQFLFAPAKTKFVGDFAAIYPRITDIDPCRDNLTPVVGFLDFGQTVRNWQNHPEYLANGDSTTGGSPGGTYGIAGGWVTNFSGGLSLNEYRLTNEVWSPWIQWDLPTTDDDDVAVAGAFIRFTVWEDLPLVNGMFWVWHVRSLVGTPGVDGPGPWQDRNFVHYGTPGRWRNIRQDVSNLIQNNADYVQVGLGAWDFADVFGFPGTTATPSPVFDNVAFYKYRIGGPNFATRTIDTAQDGFPANGLIDTADPDLLDIPFDMARDVNSGQLVIGKGDSVIVDVTSTIPGAAVTDIRMVWALKQNTALSFNEVQPSRPKDANFQDLGGGIWTGEVVADTATTSTGAIINDRYFVDLPDEDFLHPGAVLQYYMQATDSDGRTTTLPGDLSGFGDFSLSATACYNRAFTVRGLPTLADDGSQPELLVLNDFGRRGGEPSWTTALHALGYQEGVDYDSYTVQGPSSQVSNGIGYAVAGQLDGYRRIFYFAGDLATGLLSNGESWWGGNDKADDIGILNDWLGDVSSPRHIALFGDYIGSAHLDYPQGQNFVSSVMGIDVLGQDVRPVIGGQTAPMVEPNDSAVLPPVGGLFSTSYVAYGGCLSINQFDQIQPLVGAEAGHYFLDGNGLPITSPTAGVASVINDHGNGFAMTFPYSSIFVYDPISRAAGPSARTMLFGEILTLFGGTGYAPPIVGAPAARRSVLSLQPNPFNPSTLISFSNTFGKTGSVKVFNLRGELVRTLHEGEFTQADGFSRIWDGTDDQGASVASGVYVIQARADGQTESKKAALVK